MRRFACAIIVGWLALSASGVTSLLIAEPCTSYDLAGEPEDEGACPPTCVTCGCCAQAVEPVTLSVVTSPHSLTADVVAVLLPLPISDPRDILHVPKLVLV